MTVTQNKASPVNGEKSLSPRERAESRARELLEGGFDPEDAAGGRDEFYVDLDVIPDGWTYEWKRHLVMGAIDPTHEVDLRKAGWETVPTVRHPDLMPVGTRGGDPITRKGMILMERPTQITERVRKALNIEARNRITDREESMKNAPPGTLQRETKDHGSLLKMNKTYSPVEIPD